MGEVREFFMNKTALKSLWSGVRPFLVFVVPVVIGLGSAEVLTRWMYPLVAPPFGRKVVDYLLDSESVFPDRPLLVSSPFLSYTNAPNWEGGGFKQTNSLGYRSPEYAVERTPQIKRIVTIGGSTTFSYPYVADPKLSWSAQLEDQLNQQGKRYEVWNGGLNSATTMEHVSHYQFRHRFLKPDWVVIHVGVNDTAPLMLPGFEPGYTHYRRTFVQYPFRVRPHEQQWLKSYVVRTAYAWWLDELIDARFALRKRKFSSFSPAEVLDAANRNPITTFRGNLTALVDAIRRDGARPVLFQVEMAPESLQREMGYRNVKYWEGRRVALLKVREVLERVAKTERVSLVRVVMKPEYYVDHVHVDERGERTKARAIFDVVHSGSGFTGE